MSQIGQTKEQTPAISAEQQSDNVAHALAGAGGGLASMALTYPLITLSTRAQVESKKAQTNTLAAARRIIAREGIRGLYAGLESALFGITVTNFVYYYWYEWTRAFFIKAAKTQGRLSQRLTTLESMAAGAIAGSLTVLMTNPIWVVNTRMTARKSEADNDVLPTVEGEKQKKASSPSTIGTLMAILREEGPTRLFAGVLPALVLVINPILQYTIFEQLKNTLERRRKVTPTDSFYLGALGKLAATTITYPYITVKSRAHVATGEGSKEGMISSFNRIRREEGWAGLYGGIGPKVTQSVLTAAFLFAFKDALYDATIKARRTVSKA
ncbi:peroxisomal membrane protein-like protein [Elsinoe ampelina]|uniref:Peroxisomal membrane protein-like protein n=1 Tax=Elsinoe ampelina TaxID=302913 RepID=A0A6A6G7C6_9PEZI|nr:peroxisomal membrane protein-like protein [Elsinoe ampelina]